MKNKEFSPKRKDRIKVVRSILQAITLCIVLIVIIELLVSYPAYKPYGKEAVSSEPKHGFIAVSYFGVDRNGDSSLISTEALEKQIKALKDNSYVTITQQDILDYYNNGKTLPERALFLFFEDGRRDTAMFAEKILEEYNYKATILTYADKFEKKDPKFLTPNDLKALEDSTYWELGTNGYRLEFINVFDRDSNFLGNMNSLEFSKAASLIRRDYNHYLMDYIRDENRIPLETYEELGERISSDYKSLSTIYTKELGNVPALYALMHSNTGKFGTNDKASEINGTWIKNLFAMNFNREGNSLNQTDSSIYDLTRLQPQAYWTTNHLLMRIWDDTKREISFVTGDEEKASKFQEIKGQAEFRDDKIIITSQPKDKGLVKLSGIENQKNVKVSVALKGNVIGSQAIHLRAKEDGSSGLYVQLINNKVNIIENYNGSENIKFSLDLSDKEANKEIDIKEPGNRKLNIELADNKLTVAIDEKKIVEDIEVAIEDEGSILLESAWGDYGYSQRNIADDVYDGVFESFKVTDSNNRVLFDASLKGKEAAAYKVKNSFNKVVNWFIKNL
jgi:hypothetical protein